MSYHLNFNPHVVLAQPRDPDTSPYRLMLRHVLLEISNHSCESFVVNRNMVGVYPKNLRPAFAAGVLQVQFHVPESLVDLGVDFLVDNARVRVPASYTRF